MLILPSQPRVSFSTQPSPLLLLGQWLSRVCQATPPLLLSSRLVSRLLTLQWPGTRQMGLIPSQLSQPPRRSQLRFPRMEEGRVLPCGCRLLPQPLQPPRLGQLMLPGFRSCHSLEFKCLFQPPLWFSRGFKILLLHLLGPPWGIGVLHLLAFRRGRLVLLWDLTGHPPSCTPGVS